jgi:hypothetical protein
LTFKMRDFMFPKLTQDSGLIFETLLKYFFGFQSSHDLL